MPSDLLLASGTRVFWRSQANASATTKVGVIVAYLPPGTSGFDHLPPHVKRTQIMFDSLLGSGSRYLVRVDRVHARTGEPLAPHYYTPYVRLVKEAPNAD